MRKLLLLFGFTALLFSCTVDELEEPQSRQDEIDKDKYEVPPNGIEFDQRVQGIDKDKYEVPPNG